MARDWDKQPAASSEIDNPVDDFRSTATHRCCRRLSGKMRVGVLLKSALFLLCVSLVITDGYKILFLVPFPGPSHWLMLKHFIRELTVRQHEVTCITSFKFGEPLANYTEVLIDPPYPIRETFPIEGLFASSQTKDLDKLHMYWEMGINTSRHGLETENVRQFIARRDLHFDLVVAEQFFQESWLMFAYKFRAPIVTISTYGYSDFFDRIMGLRTPWSFVPHMILSYEDDMSYGKRSYNAVISLFDWYYRNFKYLPAQDQIAKETFAAMASERGWLPSVQQLEQSIAVILVNSHPILNAPRPTIRGLVDIAGAHIRPPKPLPDELRQFMDDAPHGVIYFSLGAYMQSAVMPLEKRTAILNVFGKLRQRVVWKFEDTSKMTNIPSNVMIRQWAPQNDILAHRNTILFISHGGQFGTFEAMHHGVPTLFLPFFGDQNRNADRAIRMGFARKMLFVNITEQSFGDNIAAMVDSTSPYMRRATEISRLFTDRIVDPMEESIFWMEYVARHGGAPHLKSKAVELNWLQYYMLDVFLLPLLLIWIIYRYNRKISIYRRK